MTGETDRTDRSSIVIALSECLVRNPEHEKYLLSASCLLHEQPGRVSALYITHLFALLCIIVHWVADLAYLLHTGRQIVRRERLTLSCSRRLR